MTKSFRTLKFKYSVGEYGYVSTSVYSRLFFFKGTGGWELSFNHTAGLCQSCLTLCNPMDCSPPGSSVHGILQARILEWVAISSPRGSSQIRDGNCISFDCCICTDSLLLSHQGSPVVGDSFCLQILSLGQRPIHLCKPVFWESGYDIIIGHSALCSKHCAGLGTFHAISVA